MATLLPIALCASPIEYASTVLPGGVTVIVHDTLPPCAAWVDSSLWLLRAWRSDGAQLTLSVKELFIVRSIFDADPFADVWLPIWH